VPNSPGGVLAILTRGRGMSIARVSGQARRAVGNREHQAVELGRRDARERHQQHRQVLDGVERTRLLECADDDFRDIRVGSDHVIGQSKQAVSLAAREPVLVATRPSRVRSVQPRTSSPPVSTQQTSHVRSGPSAR